MMPIDAVSPTPVVVPRHKEPENDTNVRHTEPMQIVKIIHPVQPVFIQMPEPVVAAPVSNVPVVSKQQPNPVVEPRQTIRAIQPPNNSKNSDNSKNSVIPANSDPKPEFKKPNETAPLTPFERIGKVGRQRKYEEKGNRGENSVRDVVLYRYIKERPYPGLSSDMKRWYEFFYFKSPMRGEKPFNANTNYEQHVESYERGREWIKRYETGDATGSLGHSGPIDLQARRAAH